MERVNKGGEQACHTSEDRALYCALAAGDLPGAWLLTRALMDKASKEKRSYITIFNCGLCFYRLGEYEKAHGELKQAEQLLGNPSDFDIAEKKLLTEALALAGKEIALLPLDPDSGKKLRRYGLLRVKWLMTLCLLQLGRPQEAASGIRFLRQYHIELP